MNNDKWFEESEALDAMIAKKGLQAKSEYFYAIGNNSPFHFGNWQCSEVWREGDFTEAEIEEICEGESSVTSCKRRQF